MTKKQQLISNLMSHLNDDQKLFDLRAAFEAQKAEQKGASEYTATEGELKKLLADNCFSAMTGKLLGEYSEYNY